MFENQIFINNFLSHCQLDTSGIYFSMMLLFTKGILPFFFFLKWMLSPLCFTLHFTSNYIILPVAFYFLSILDNWPSTFILHNLSLFSKLVFLFPFTSPNISLARTCLFNLSLRNLHFYIIWDPLSPDLWQGTFQEDD